MSKIKSRALTLIVALVLLISIALTGCGSSKNTAYVTEDDIRTARQMVFSLVEKYLASLDIDGILGMFPPEMRDQMRPEIEAYINTWLSLVGSSEHKPRILWLKVTSVDRYAPTDPVSQKFKILFKVRYEGLYKFWVPDKERYVDYRCEHSAWIEFVKYKGKIYLLQLKSLGLPSCQEVSSDE